MDRNYDELNELETAAYYGQIKTTKSFTQDECSEILHKFFSADMDDVILKQLLTKTKITKKFISEHNMMIPYGSFEIDRHFVRVFQRDFLPYLKEKKDKQYLFFTERQTRVNTLNPFRTRMTDEDKHISKLQIKALNAAYRSKPKPQIKRAIKYVKQELEANK